jgi:hypothetical protein
MNVLPRPVSKHNLLISSSRIANITTGMSICSMIFNDCIDFHYVMNCNLFK